MARIHFEIEALPAEDGDCLCLNYGDDASRFHLLIDGGRLSTYARIVARRLQRVELLVLTHIDADHLEGAIRLLAERPLPIDIGEIWFNGFAHADAHTQDPDDVLRTSADDDYRSPRQGDYIGALIRDGLAKEIWNTSWQGKAVVIGAGETLPSVPLRGGLQLTLLSPTRRGLERLANVWRNSLGAEAGDHDAALAALARIGRYGYASGSGEQQLRGTAAADASADDELRRGAGADTSVANGSSIAFLAEYAGKRALLLGDAHAQVIRESLARLLGERGLTRLPVNVLKLAHHGSAANVTPELLHLIDAEHVIVSTSGALHGHPDLDAIRLVARSAQRPMTFHFNYASACSPECADAIAAHGHRVSVAADGASTRVVMQAETDGA